MLHLLAKVIIISDKQLYFFSKKTLFLSKIHSVYVFIRFGMISEIDCLPFIDTRSSTGWGFPLSAWPLHSCTSANLGSFFFISMWFCFFAKRRKRMVIKRILVTKTQFGNLLVAEVLPNRPFMVTIGKSFDFCKSQIFTT